MSSLKKLWQDILSIRRMPIVSVDLMRRETEGNDPFFAGMVDEYFQYTRRRHPRFPLVRRDAYGVALRVLPSSADEYFMAIESSGRRNVRKARRLGYTFERIDNINDYIGDVHRICTSADVRQGEMDEALAHQYASPTLHPRSSTDVHDYAHYGVLKDGVLYAYAACMIAGEGCMIEQIFGDARRQSDGLVPMLIVGIATSMLEHHPKVKYYTYDTFFGAGLSLRRFKKKFAFIPHRVRWVRG